VRAVLAEGDDERVKEVLSYERAQKDHAGVRAAAERELTTRKRPIESARRYAPPKAPSIRR
jgi:hypothetical protein